jgi:quercetin dioxygenase-like cupin family protein
MTESKYGKYIVTELNAPFSQDFNAQYAKWATRVLWIDDKVVEGAFHMNVSWYLRPQTGQQPIGAHRHDSNEIIGFFGNNHEDPYELGGEVEFWLEDEKHMITRSCLIFVPAGMQHCPLVLRRVDRPIFHFSAVNSSEYLLKEARK